MGIFIFSKIFAFCPNLLIFFQSSLLFSESWKFILFKFYHVRAGARTRARQFFFEWWKSRKFWLDMSFLENASKKFKFTNFDFLQNREFLSKFNNFFSSESWGFIFFKFYHARTRACTRARQNHIFWKFSDLGIFSKFPAFKVKLARACARAGARMIKFEKYGLSAFAGKKKN